MNSKLIRLLSTIAMLAIAVQVSAGNGVITPHEAADIDRKVDDGKCGCHFAAPLALLQNFAQQLNRGLFGPAKFRRPHRVHRTRKNYGLPQRAANLGDFREGIVKPVKPFGGGGFSGKLRLQAFGLARESAASDFAQYRVLAREVTKKCGLADLQNLHDVVNASVLVSTFAEKPK